MTAQRQWVVYATLVALGPAWAQNSNNGAQPPASRQRAKKNAQLKKELSSGWDRWLNEDVAWIMTDEERKSFSQLGTDEEREQFVEQFWLRRDPTPDSIENEYKEEHYRRIAYANQHFASGIPGWKADRGRIYIRFGPPDEIDSHPSGGTWERPAAEGGGTTTTYPFEQWRYRHLDGVGEDIVIEFVDPTLTGEYRMTIDPCEKDALTNVPGAGPTLAEQVGLSTKLARFQNTDGTHCGAPLGARPESYNPFTRLEQQANLEKAPGVKFRDLEATVSARVSYNVLPMRVQVDYLRVTNFSVLTNITVQLENRDLEFRTDKAVVDLAGRVYTLGRRPVSTFERTLEISPANQSHEERSVYQESTPLAPGRYKLEIIAKDLTSGNIARYETALDVPRYEEGKLGASSLIVADAIEPLPLKRLGGGMFAIGDTKVRPRVDGRFTQSEKLGIYLQVYSAAVDGPSPRRVNYEIEKAGTTGTTGPTGTKEKPVEFSEEVSGGNASQLTIQKLLPLRSLGPGEYTLKVRVAEGSLTVERQARFTVRP